MCAWHELRIFCLYFVVFSSVIGKKRLRVGASEFLNQKLITRTFLFSFPISNRMRKKMQRKTSYQKTKEEFENVQEKRRLKKEVKHMPYLFNAR